MYIYSIGHYFPENILDNAFFDRLDIESSADWISDRVGIDARRSVLTQEQVMDLRHGRTTRERLKAEGAIETIASMSEKAWNMAKARSPEVNATLDTAIGGTSVPDDDIPSNGCVISARLGLEQLRAFDVNSACSTFVVQCHVMRGLVTSGLTKEAAIFCAERYTTRMDFSDRRNCILFGDASVAALVSSQKRPGSLKLVDSLVESSPSGWEHIHLADGKHFHQNGAQVQKFAITKTITAAQDILARNQLKTSDAQWFIGHQANYRMLTTAMEKMGVHESRHLFNVRDRGNQGAAGAPSVLSQNWDRYQKGDYIVVAVVGAGLTWGSLLLQKQ
jgi:3-oxoacyl-[acyl-carrier-protein] synthase III